MVRVLRPGTNRLSSRALAASRSSGTSLVAYGFSISASRLTHGKGGTGGWPWAYTIVLPTAYSSHLRGEPALSARFWHRSSAAVFAASSLGCARLQPTKPLMLRATALESP